MYTFLLTVKKESSVLTLLQEGKEKATKTWSERRDMGSQLFRAIVDLLKENGLKSVDISNFELKTDVSDNSTPFDSKEDSFWSKPRQSPPFDNPENLPLLSDLTGLTSVKIGETVQKTFLFATKMAQTSRRTGKVANETNG